MGTEDEGGTFGGAATVLIDVVFAFGEVGGDRSRPDLRRFAHGSVAFSHDDNFLARYAVFLESFADDFFGFAVGVDIRCIPGIEPHVIGSFENWKCLNSLSIRYVIGFSEGLSYLVFSDNPRLPLLITKRHSTQYRHRDSQATLAKLSVLDLGAVNGLLDRFG